MAIVIGLDWMQGDWAMCAFDSSAKRITPQFRAISTDQLASDRDVLRAALLVVDTPIGLPPGVRGCALRGCDVGAKRLLGARHSAVFPVPVAGELETYRRRRKSGEKQDKGHFRGLLPSIDAIASAPASLRDRIVESHPEVVFSVLAGGALPRCAGKKGLFGQLVRLGVLSNCGVAVTLEELPTLIPADDYVDAAALALTALAWEREKVRPAIGSSGSVAPYDPAGAWAPFMALPKAPARALRALPLGECLVTARTWLASTAKAP